MIALLIVAVAVAFLGIGYMVRSTEAEAREGELLDQLAERDEQIADLEEERRWLFPLPEWLADTETEPHPVPSGRVDLPYPAPWPDPPAAKAPLQPLVHPSVWHVPAVNQPAAIPIERPESPPMLAALRPLLAGYAADMRGAG